MMIRYELKKIFGSTGGRIALGLYIATVILSCFLAANGFMNVGVKWVNEQGESERGFGAVTQAKDADAMILANMPMPGAVICSCNNLKFIDVAFTGVDHADLVAAKEKGIAVSNASGC